MYSRDKLERSLNTKNNVQVEKYHSSQEVFENKNERLSNNVHINNNGINEFLEQSLKWIKTPLCDFGFKCIQSKHDSCSWTKCKCLCHQKEQK